MWDLIKKLDVTVTVAEPDPPEDEDFSGQEITMTAGEDLVFGDICYLKSDGKWWKAKADSATTMPCMAMASTSISADADGVFILPGEDQFVRNDTWTWTKGGLLYPSPSTAGTMTQTLPSASGQQVQVLGYAYTATVIVFHPSPVLVEIA